MFSQEQWGQLLANFIEEAKELIQQAEAALLQQGQQRTQPAQQQQQQRQSGRPPPGFMGDGWIHAA